MENRKIIRSAFVVTLALLVTRLLGLIRESVLASTYGAGMVSDAFIISFTMPDTILACIGTSLGTVFIPLFQENKEDSNKFTSNIINITTILGVCLTIVFICFPGILVTLFSSGFDAETYELTVLLTRIMMLSTIPILLFNVLKAFLQIHNAFFLASALDGIINILVIGGILTSKATSSYLIMAYATVAGKIICFICLIISCNRHQLRYNFYLNPFEESIKKLVKLLLPVFIGTAVAELNTIVDRNFASTLVSGTVSAMNYANKISGILYTFIGTSIVTVLYPEIVRLVSDNETKGVKEHLRNSIVLLAYIIVPLTVIVIILAEPIIKILFQHGSFAVEDTVMTAQCVRMDAISYLAININPILIRVFYAYGDTKTPTINSVAAVALNIILNFLMVRSLKHIGLSLSTSISAIFITGLLLIQLRKRLRGIDIRREMIDLVKIVIAGGAMCVCLWFGYAFGYRLEYGFIKTIIYTGTISILGGAIYIVLTYVMKVRVLKDVCRIIIEKRKKRMGYGK